MRDASLQPFELRDFKKIVSLFQSDVMHLSDDATKLKLFMDVLDGTNAAVRNRHFFRLRCLFFLL